MAGTVSIDYIDIASLPDTAVDRHGDTLSVTGVSGLVWAGGDSWLAVMDNSDLVLHMDIDIAADGSIDIESVEGLRLQGWGDFEDIAIDASGNIMLSDEGAQEIAPDSASSEHLRPEAWQSWLRVALERWRHALDRQ